MNNRTFCILHCIKSNLNECKTGTDYGELTDICYVLVEEINLKVLDILKYSVRSLKQKNLSDNLQKGDDNNTANRNLFTNTTNLAEIIANFDRAIFDKNLNAENVFFITEDSSQLRQILIPICVKQGIELPAYYYSYFDIRKELEIFDKKMDQKIGNYKNLSRIINEIYSNPRNENDSLVIKCLNIRFALLQIYENGYCLNDCPEIINQTTDRDYQLYYHGNQIEEETVVKIRGLPWHCPVKDILTFFAGLNISGDGVAFCLNAQGRRNGEALVRFENEEQRQLAILRHKDYIGTRYIEVYRATGSEFLEIAGGTNSEAQEFFNRDGKIIIRMRGLPFDAVAKNVIEFFEESGNSEILQSNKETKIQIVDGEKGVLFVHYPDGRATGDAFVMVRTEEECAQALLKHKAMMGARYIELFRTTTAEVQQVLKRSQDPKNYQSHFKEAALTMLPSEMISAGNVKDCVRLKNLPIEATVEHILDFMGIHSQHIVPQGIHMIFNTSCQPSGEAFIQFDSELSALNVFTFKNGKIMYFGGKRFAIEVFQCSGEEMNLILMGVSQSNLINQTTNSFHFDHSQAYLNNNLAIHDAHLIQDGQFDSKGFFQSAQQNEQTNQFYNNQPQTSSGITQFYNPITNFVQPIFYYMSPPISPLTSNVYLSNMPLPQVSKLAQQHPCQPSQFNSCVLIIKHAPINITVNQIATFLSAYEDISPELIQIHNQQITNSADVFVTFYNRKEAERAVIEKNHQKLGSHIVELFLIV